VTVLVFISVVFLLETAATIADGYEGPSDMRPWLLLTYAAALLLAFAPKSLAVLGVIRRR
jgi:hypothetical protein